MRTIVPHMNTAANAADTVNCRHCDALLTWHRMAYLDSDGARRAADGHRHMPAARPFDEVARIAHGAEYDEPIPGEPGYRRPARV